MLARIMTKSFYKYGYSLEKIKVLLFQIAVKYAFAKARLPKRKRYIDKVDKRSRNNLLKCHILELRLINT